MTGRRDTLRLTNAKGAVVGLVSVPEMQAAEVMAACAECGVRAEYVQVLMVDDAAFMRALLGAAAPPPPRKPDQCALCEHQAKHDVGLPSQLCCECYVTAGHKPADWHQVCMLVHEKGRRLTPAEWRRVLGKPRKNGPR